MPRLAPLLHGTFWFMALVRPVAAAPPTSRVDQVLVYSDRAKVSRLVEVSLGAAGPTQPSQVIELCDLPQSLIADSVQVACPSAEVLHVEVSRASRLLPRQVQAQSLAGKLEALDDQRRLLEQERQVLRSELDLLAKLQPATMPADKDPGALPVENWPRIFGWTEGRSGKIRDRLAVISTEQHKLAQARHPLEVQARALQESGRAPSRVVAMLKGKAGTHRVRVSYFVSGARWLPSYDLRYLADKQRVEASYFALVSQRSGEDWTEAELRFSTAQATTLLAIPELPTWTLGRRSDYQPTPTPRRDPAQQVWRPADDSGEDGGMRRLQLALGPPAARPAASVTTTPTRGAGDVLNGLEKLVQLARQQRDVVKLNCLNDKLTQLKVLLQMAQKTDAEQRSADPSLVQHARSKIQIIEQKIQGLKKESEACVGEEAAYAGSTTVETHVDELADRRFRTKARISLLRDSVLGGPIMNAQVVSAHPAQPSFFGRTERSTERLPWNEVGYRPPPLDPQLPAAAAQGYHYTLYAPGRHTISATGVERRIPLLRQGLSVQPVHRVAPALSRAAYLVADVKNNTGRPILRGNANLFVGSTYSGRSWLETALPGASLLLPLGVDDSVKVSRTLDKRTVTKGIVFKDDVTEYTVTIELANHHRYAIRLQVEDQVPLPQTSKIKVQGFSANPVAERPDQEGKVRFEVILGPSQMKRVAFSYRIVRPKDWELRQPGYALSLGAPSVASPAYAVQP